MKWHTANRRRRRPSRVPVSAPAATPYPMVCEPVEIQSDGTVRIADGFLKGWPVPNLVARVPAAARVLSAEVHLVLLPHGAAPAALGFTVHAE